jgi:ABC-2 type transport system ATP-binding protein
VGVDVESFFLEHTGTTPVNGQSRQVDETAMAPAPGGWGQ